MSSGGCPAAHELAAFAQGRLQELKIEAVAAHLDRCPACEATVASLETAPDGFLVEIRQPCAAEMLAEPAFQQALRRVAALPAPAAAGDVPVAPLPLPAIGQYQLIEKLGEGGMGTVYKALHVKLEKTVAIKLLPAARGFDDHAVARFEREMKAVGRLEHPHLVRATDAGQEGGQPFLVMEYVDGLELGELVGRCGPLPIADACEIICQAADGLEYIRQHGMVHRDIKPSNLMLTWAGQVKVMDLGLALLTGERQGLELTGTGQVMGTADYMAPEQALASHDVDIRSDIYSLGCTLYKLLTGGAPFGGPQYDNAAKKVLAHLQTPPPPVAAARPDVPPGLGAMVERLLAKSPDERFATPAAVATALAPFAAGSDLRALLGRARHGDDAPAARPPYAVGTEDHLSSALTSTTEHAAQAARSQGKPLPQIRPKPAEGARGRLPPRRRRAALAAVALAAASGLVLCTVIIWINHKRVEVPDGTEVHVGDDGQARVVAPAPLRIAAEPVRYSPREPLSAAAIVARPAMLPGVLSWTIETRTDRWAEQSNSAARFSPDGRWLAVPAFSPSEGTIRLYRTEDFEVVKLLIGSDRNIADLHWLPDSQHLATLDDRGTMWLWNVATGQRLRRIELLGPPGPKERWWCWSPDGRQVGAHTDGHWLSLFDVASGGVARRIERRGPAYEQGRRLWGSFWSPDGRLIASLVAREGEKDCLLDVWDAETGASVYVLPLPGIEQKGMWEDLPVAWSPDSKRLAVMSRKNLELPADKDAGEIRLLDVATGQWVGALPVGVWGEIHWSPDGQFLAVNASEFPLVRYPNVRPALVEVGTGKLFPLPGLVGTLRGWSADSRWLAISTEKRLDVWDVAQAKLHTQIKANEERTHLQFQLPRVPVAGPWQPAWSPRSQSVVLCEYQSSALVVGLDTEWKVVPLVGSSRWYNWSPDGRLLATGCRESPGAMLWDGQTGQPSKALPGKGPAVSEVAFSPDGARLAAVQGAEGVAIYDVAQRSLLTTLATEQRGVVGVLWSPDSRRLAAADGKRIVVWDLGADGAPPASLEGHTGDVRCLDWSPDSTAIASGGGEGEVRIWDVAQRTCRQTLRPQKQTAVDRLCWSPTGARLATEAGFVIEVWEIASGNAVGSFHARPGMLNSWLTVFAWSPDGNALAAGFTQWLRGTEMLDNALAIWQAASGQWIGIKPEPNPGFLLARSQGPAMLRWAADGRRLTCAHYDNTLRSYDAATGAALDRVSAYPRATCVVQLAVAPNGRFAAASTSDWHAVLWNAESGEPLGAVRLFANCGYLQVSADGRYRASPEIEKQIVYVVQTAAGQETLAPAEFAERFGWKNDPPARDPH